MKAIRFWKVKDIFLILRIWHHFKLTWFVQTTAATTTNCESVSWTCFLVSSEACHACALNTVPSLCSSECVRCAPLVTEPTTHSVGKKKETMGALYKINQRTTTHPSTVQYCEFLSQLNSTLQFLYLFAHEPPCYGLDMAWPPRDACMGGLVSSQQCLEGIVLNSVFRYWWAHGWMGYWQVESLWRKWIMECVPCP